MVSRSRMFCDMTKTFFVTSDLELNSAGNSYRCKFRQLPKSAFKKHVHDLLLLIMEAEDNYVETLILLYKIANLHNL